MIIWLLGLFFTNYIFTGSSSDNTVFLLFLDEYDLKTSFNNNLSVGATLTSDTSVFVISQPSLMSKDCIKFNYFQQVFDNAFGVSYKDYLIGKTVFRSRILWGSYHEGFLLRDSNIFWLKTIKNKHDHEISKNLIWLREGWIALDLSKFMGMTRSVCMQVGSLPYEIGRGISYGQAYLEGTGFLGFDASNVIDEFAPAFLLTGTFYKTKNSFLDADFYCAILDNDTTYLKEIIEPIYKNRIKHCPSYIERGFGHINTVFIASLRHQMKLGSCLIQSEPYVILNIIPEVNLEFEAQAKSKLLTLGAMLEYSGSRSFLNFEFAINKGGLDIYGWDRNYLEPSNREGYLVIENNNIFEGEDKALNTLENSNIIENSPQGEEFNGDYISTKLKNSRDRFSDPRNLDYNGAMMVLDFAYSLKKDEIYFAFTSGFSSGGSDPIFNKSESSYSGFIPLQELYTGLWVQSAFGIGGPYFRPLNQDFSENQRYNSFVDNFTNLKFCGFSLRRQKKEDNFIFQLNSLFYWEFSKPLGFDINNLKNNDIVIDDFIGSELYLLSIYNPKNIEALFYLALSVFTPGGRLTSSLSGPTSYFDILNIDKLSAPDKSKYNLSYLINAGFFYYF